MFKDGDEVVLITDKDEYDKMAIRVISIVTDVLTFLYKNEDANTPQEKQSAHRT